MVGSGVSDRVASIAARYRRTLPTWLRPVEAALRATPRLVARHHHTMVDARRLQTVTNIIVPAIDVHRHVATAAPVVDRLLARGERTTANVAAPRDAHRTATDRPAADARGRVASQPPPVRPVPMVLARPVVQPAHPAVPGAGAPPGWPSDATSARAPVRGDAATEPRADLTPHDVGRITDRVVAAIDRRLLAARERTRS